jgi:hypothetical protein
MPWYIGLHTSIVRTSLSLPLKDQRATCVSALPSGRIHVPNYPVVYLPREGLVSPASDGLIIRLSMTARLAKSRIFSSGLVASADFCCFGPVVALGRVLVSY